MQEKETIRNSDIFQYSKTMKGTHFCISFEHFQHIKITLSMIFSIKSVSSIKTILLRKIFEQNVNFLHLALKMMSNGR